MEDCVGRGWRRGGRRGLWKTLPVRSVLPLTLSSYNFHTGPRVALGAA